MDATVRVRKVAWFATAIVLTLFATLLVTESWRVDAAPGDTDSTFVPITACRLIDTRQPGQTAFTAKETRTLAAHGSNGDCTIPPDAVGISMNMTALDASAATFVTVWSGGTFPTASSLNPAPGQPPTPNAVTTTLSNNGSFNVYNDAGTIGLIIDINGYYTKTTLKELAAGLATANAKIADSEARIAALENALPFAVSGVRVSATGLLTTTPVSYLDVTVTAPVDGQVTLNYSTYVTLATATPEAVLCAPFRSTEIPASLTIQDEGIGYWKIGAVSSSNASSVSGTRTFDISAGQTVIYSVACEETGGVGSVGGRTATAIFTPAP